jgi:hypothetical protein
MICIGWPTTPELSGIFWNSPAAVPAAGFLLENQQFRGWNRGFQGKTRGRV